MLAMDLGDWHPRKGVPQTEGLAMQKRESAPAELQWLWGILDDGVIPETMHDGGGMQVVRVKADQAHVQALWMHCKRSSPSLRYGFTRGKFSEFMAKFGVIRTKRKNVGVMLQFPPLDTMRAKFRAVYPWMEAFTPGDDSWFIEDDDAETP